MVASTLAQNASERSAISSGLIFFLGGRGHGVSRGGRELGAPRLGLAPEGLAAEEDQAGLAAEDPSLACLAPRCRGGLACSPAGSSPREEPPGEPAGPGEE